MSLQKELKNKNIYQNEITKIYPQSIPREFDDYLSTFPNHHPMKKQFIPSHEEITNTNGLYDPIGDSLHSKENGIIHRYKNRLLFTPTTVCPIQCRYCFRKNELAQRDELFKASINELISYLQNHQEINEVILTGGDPLMLSNDKIETIFKNLTGLVDYIRFHTRAPVIIPKRIDNDFIRLLKSYEPHFKIISIAIHTNHPDELYPAVDECIELLKSTKVKLLSQTVLLKDVNNNLETMTSLFKNLSERGVQPYYLHHPDKVKGAMHFYLPLIEGRELYGKLRDELPGFMLPHYVIDPSNGRGKTLAYNGESLDFSGSLIDRFGNKFTYNE